MALAQVVSVCREKNKRGSKFLISSEEGNVVFRPKAITEANETWKEKLCGL